jgi:transposase
MTKTQVEVITSVQRRRSWSRAEKERIVAAALEPGAVASEVARAAGIHTSQLFRWRQQLCERVQVPAAFNPVAITPEPEAASSAPVAERAGVIEIEFAAGGRMRITGAVDAPTVAALMNALAKGKRRR